VRVSRPISRPLSHSLTHSLGGLGFALNPLQSLITSLFSSNEQGAFYIPKPIVNGAQALFQDVAGTVPVTADGDPDGLMIDQSPNSTNAAQTVSAQRPAYRSVSGLHYLQFDGTGDALDTSLQLSAPYSYACALTVAEGSGSMYCFGGGYFASAPAEGSGIARSGGKYVIQNRIGNTEIATHESRTVDTAPFIVVVQIAADGTITIDDETGQTVINSGLNNIEMSVPFAFGTPAGGAQSVSDFSGKIHGALAVNRLLSGLEVSNIRAYLSDLAGVV